MDAVNMLILGSLCIIFAGFPTLLVAMAWITRDRPISPATPIVTAAWDGHAARIRQTRRLAQAETVVALPALP